ncbi:SH3 domain-containing protein [Leptolyngbya sp. FACHB-321]|uniref:SH3 domain-containing protein n=1 Tax=Leptolyngbya sp. FACHB-321 TaxID=2692807 RepID=UPI001688E0C0|nr:SH3 domain-containing protein [Leptolyngbya sp. FACHB-321]
MRYSISALFIVAAIALTSCTAGNSRTGGIETLPSVPEERYTPTATSSFPGEAAHLIDETSNNPVIVRAEPSAQARSVVSVGKEEVVQVVDSTRDRQQGMWYLVQRSSGQEGWVMGQFIRFIGNPDLSARPSVVMRGGGPILAQPGNEARVVGQVRGGEVLTISRSVEVPELDNRKSIATTIEVRTQPA